MAELEHHRVGNIKNMTNNLKHTQQIPKLPKPLIPIEKPKITKPLGDYTLPAVKHSLQEKIRDITGDRNIHVTDARINIDADLAVPLHSLSKKSGQNLGEITVEISKKFNESIASNLIQASHPDNGYLNIELATNPFANKTIDEVEKLANDYGKNNSGKSKTIVIDCSSPNVAKFMSVGHLRSTVIGESLARIYKANGFTVIRDNHLGDWGTQFGMLGRAYELWGNEIPELEKGQDTINGLYKLYVKIHDEVEKQKQENPDRESSLEKEGRQWFKRLENGDPEALRLLAWSTAQSLKEFQRIYDLLGARFEYMLGESFYVSMLPNVISSLKDKHIAKRDEQGALVVNFKESDKLSRLVIQKSDGTSLYASRDLATIVARINWFKPEKIIYVVGGDQSEYFRQIFKTFENWAGLDGPKLEHVSFGMITLPEGKMSTRRGRVVFLEDVLTEAIEREKQIIKSSDRNLPPEEAEEVARQVGIGAVIYFDLGQGRERNIKFDWDSALSMEGNSAPYIQYTYARVRAIERKAQEAGVKTDKSIPVDLELPAEKNLVKHLAALPEVVAKAAQENRPSTVAEYVYKSANLFNQLYKDAPILVEQDPIKRNSRLRLTNAAGQVIKNSLYLLGIQAPERM